MSPLIRIIDDDEQIRFSLNLLLECADFTTAVYPDAESFLACDDLTRPGCILSDIRMPGISGLELQEELLHRRILLPLIFITGHGDIEMAVDALKHGAYDFLVKPVKEEKLFSALHGALSLFSAMPVDAYRIRLSLLTEREKTVLRLILQNVNTHGISARLGIGERTVQGHRWRIYQKLGLNSIDAVKKILNSQWIT